jgi:SAM-dependent methyltransferase
MRAVLEEVVPGAEALAGRGEAIPLADGEVDAVFTAEAFHWFAGEESVAEIARVLRTRGALVILWNIPVEYPHMGDEAEAVIEEAFARGGEPGLGKVLSGDWKRPVEEGPFEQLREGEVERWLVNSRDEWIANMLSVSSIAVQPDEDRAAFAERLRALIPEQEIRRRFRTVAHWTRRV